MSKIKENNIENNVINKLETFLKNEDYLNDINLIKDLISPYLNENSYYDSKKLLDKNFNEHRIKTFYCYSKLFSMEYSFLDNKKKTFEILNYRESDTKYINLWVYLSNKVKQRKMIGFPIVFYKCYENIKKLDCDKKEYKLYFEKFNTEYTNEFYSLIFDNTGKEILFQKLIILYTLWVCGYSSNYYIFNIIKIPKINITFKIRDLYFTFPISKLVILSPRTKLIDIQALEHDYIFEATNGFPEELLKDTSNFIKCLFFSFQQNLDLTMYSKMNNILIVDELFEMDNITCGDIVSIKIEDNKRLNYHFAIVLNIDLDMLELGIIINPICGSNDKFKTRQLEIIIKKFKKTEIFKKPRCIISELDYTIG